MRAAWNPFCWGARACDSLGLHRLAEMAQVGGTCFRVDWRPCLQRLCWARLHVSHACATFSKGAPAALLGAARSEHRLISSWGLPPIWLLCSVVSVCSASLVKSFVSSLTALCVELLVRPVQAASSAAELVVPDFACPCPFYAFSTTAVDIDTTVAGDHNSCAFEQSSRSCGSMKSHVMVIRICLFTRLASSCNLPACRCERACVIRWIRRTKDY